MTALDLEGLVQVRKMLEGVLARLQDRQNNLGPPESWHEHELLLSEEELEIMAVRSGRRAPRMVG